MTIVGLLVVVILVVLLIWIIRQAGIQEPMRSILIGSIAVIILVAILYVLGVLPSGRIMIR